MKDIDLTKIGELLQAAISPTMKSIETLKEFNNNIIKDYAASFAKVYSTFDKHYKALYVSNQLVNELVEEQSNEIGVIVQQEQDIDSIISLLLFKEICSKHNKEIKHIMQVSYKGKATLITKGSKEKLQDIQFYALDCEYKDNRMNVINIHNHLNNEKYSCSNIAPYAFIYKDKLQSNPFVYTSKEQVNSKQYGGSGVRRGFATAMILMDKHTNKKYHSFILAADTCSYAIVKDSYSTDNGFIFTDTLAAELERLGLNTTDYKAHLSYSRELKKSINLTQAKEQGAFVFESFKELSEEQKQVISEYEQIMQQDFEEYENIVNDNFEINRKQTMSNILEEIAARANTNIELINLALSDYNNTVYAKYTYRVLV